MLTVPVETTVYSFKNSARTGRAPGPLSPRQLPKNVLQIQRDELQAFRKLASEMLVLDNKELRAAMKNGTITEVICDE